MFPSEILAARTYKNTTPRRLKISPPRPPRLRGATAVRRAESSCWILPPMISGQKQFCCARHPKDADASPSADNRKSTRPSTTGRACGKKKHPAPRRKTKPARVIQHQKNQPRRGHRTNGRAGVDDAHRGRALVDRKPFRHDARRRRESTALAHAQQTAARHEHDQRKRYSENRGESVVGREALAGGRERPENHHQQKSPARAETIQQPATAQIHQAVSDQKRGVEQRLDLVDRKSVV